MIKKYTRKCPKCNEIVFHSSASSRFHCKNNMCRKCSDCNKIRSRCGEDSGRWKGYKGISLSYFNGLKNGAKKRNISFNITLEDMWDRFETQGGKCIYTGLELQFLKITRRGRSGTASIDRVDSSKGYIKENIQWVHKDINWMKQDFDKNYFIKMCGFVTKNHTMTEIITPIDPFIQVDGKTTTTT